MIKILTRLIAVVLFPYMMEAQDVLPLPTIPQWQVVYQGPYVPNGADYTILDLFDYRSSAVHKAKYPIAYFSAHYENWRPDARRFGKLRRPISGWRGERYIKWNDRKNQRVMKRRLALARAKGFKGVDIDNVDGPNTRKYFQWLYKQARRRGLTVGLKNAVEVLPRFGHKVHFFVSEATKESELTVYEQYQKPTVRMYYRRGALTPPYIDEVISRVDGNRF